MSIKVFFVTAILTSCTMVQMIAQVSIGKSSMNWQINFKILL